MRLFRKLALGASMLVLASARARRVGASKPTIKIGSDGFDEARVVAEIYAQALEARLHRRPGRHRPRRARRSPAAALESGQIDLKPEYIGSGLVASYGGTPTEQRRHEQASAPGEARRPRRRITVLGYTPGQDTNAFVVRKETADQFKLAKMSDLTAVQDQLKWGLATDCPTNPVCAGALKDAYGIDADATSTLLDACSDADGRRALKAKTVDVAELCSTGPGDHRQRLGPSSRTTSRRSRPTTSRRSSATTSWRRSTRPRSRSSLDDVSAKIDTATLADLYKQVAVDKKDLKDVASAWLKAQGLIK